MADKGIPSSRDPRSDFLHRFFHDLATPLSAVALHLEGADRRSRRGADPSESLAIARGELSRAFELFEMGRDCLIGSQEPARTILFDPLVAAAARASGVPDACVQGETGGRVRGDGRALEQALRDLLNNAIEAAGTEAVSVRVERAGERLRATVSNPGRLPEGDPESLFSPRLAGPGRRWGMGLPRARLFAAAAGGTVRLEQNSEHICATLELPEELD